MLLVRVDAAVGDQANQMQGAAMLACVLEGGGLMRGLSLSVLLSTIRSMRVMSICTMRPAPMLR